MNLLRRVTAVLSSALLFQLSLLASGTICPMHTDHAASSTAEHAMAHSHGTDAAASRADAMERISDPSSDAASHPAGACDMNGSSCSMPWSPGSCVAMSTCAIGTSAPSTASVTFAELPTLAIVSRTAAALPIGPTYAPELPPPRG